MISEVAEGEGERERESHAVFTPSVEPDMGFDLATVRS